MKSAPSMTDELRYALERKNWHDAAAFAAQALDVSPEDQATRFLLAELHARNFSARLAANELRRVLLQALASGDAWRAVAAQVALDQCRPGAGPEAFTRILETARTSAGSSHESHALFSLEPQAFDAQCRDFAHVSLLPGDSWHCPGRGTSLIVCISGDPRTGSPGEGEASKSPDSPSQVSGFLWLDSVGSRTLEPLAPASFLYLDPSSYETASRRWPALKSPEAWTASAASSQDSAVGGAVPAALDEAGDRHEVMLSIRCLIQESGGGEAALSGGQLVEVSERGCSFECSTLPVAFQAPDPAGARVVVQVHMRNRPEPLRWHGTLANVSPSGDRPGTYQCGIRWNELTAAQRAEIQSLARGTRRESAQLWQLWNSSAEARR